jgi:hypothetical protein
MATKWGIIVDDKDLLICAPEGVEIELIADYDDVNHEVVEAVAKRICAILEVHTSELRAIARQVAQQYE